MFGVTKYPSIFPPPVLYSKVLGATFGEGFSIFSNIAAQHVQDKLVFASKILENIVDIRD